MHKSAFNYAKLFFDTYAQGFTDGVVIEIGSQDVNGSLRSLSPVNAKYIGVDYIAGNGVDVVLDDPYQFQIEDASADIVICSSCFEHAEMFWLTFLEVMRILKQDGVFYLNAPSNGIYHQYPNDCWRFYPDSGRALVAWARRSGINAGLLESFTGMQGDDIWNDYVAVFIKDVGLVDKYPTRMVHGIDTFCNGTVYGGNDTLRPSDHPEDYLKLQVAEHKLNTIRSLPRLSAHEAKEVVHQCTAGNDQPVCGELAGGYRLPISNGLQQQS